MEPYTNAGQIGEALFETASPFLRTENGWIRIPICDRIKFEIISGTTGLSSAEQLKKG